MSSKSKKKPSKNLSNSPRTPNSTSKISANCDPADYEVKALLREASNNFPYTIGSSAFFGKIIDISTRHRGSKLWLSESTMVAYSFVPGSVVSVSFAATGGKYSDGFPLLPLSYSCNYDAGKTYEIGHYFAFASVYSSNKLAKNEIKLSIDLHFTIGSPDEGAFLFVYCVQNQSLDKIVTRKHENAADSIFVFENKEICLEFVDVKIRRGSTKKGEEPVTPYSAIKKQCDASFSSPATPKETSVTKSLEHRDSVKEALRDCRSKKIVETCSLSWLQSRVLLPGNLVNIPLLSTDCVFSVKFPANLGDQDVVQTQGNRIYALLVNKETKVHLLVPSSSSESADNDDDIVCSETPFETNPVFKRVKLGGLGKEHDSLMQVIESNRDKSYCGMAFRPAKGVLLHGPSGTGKTSLARLCCLNAGVRLFTICGPEIIGQYYGESEQAMSNLFHTATQAAPAVVFIDELDAIAPARKHGGEELSQRMVACLLNLMDGVNRDDGVLVIAASNRPDSIEPALRRAGRFDLEIEIGVPSADERHDILVAMLGNVGHSLSNEEIRRIASSTHGFVGSDLSALCNEAFLSCFQRHTSSMWESDWCEVLDDLLNPDESESRIRKKFAEVMTIEYDDFESARVKVRPSAMKEVILEVPKVRWEDVGGQTEAKMQLKAAVEWRQKHKHVFERLGTKPPSGVLMFGPPGCSKTLLARAVASEAGLNFLAVKGPELYNKWVGESEKAVRSLFAKARANAPSIIFFDEIDALAVARGSRGDNCSVSDRVMSQLLVELDGWQDRTNVIVIAATNRPDKLEKALLRPGRFDRCVYVGLPDEADREEIFRIHLRGKPCGADVDVKELASLTSGCSGALIASICNAAAYAALEEDINASSVKMEHFRTAVAKVGPSRVEDYELLYSQFQRLAVSDHSKESPQF